jgi:phenylacetate-CoA ligase
MHIFEDAFIPEIIDPETCETLPPGSVGELVLTTLTKEAFPMIRYRTRDITSLDYTQCDCGRTIVRMKKTMGRSDDMLIIKGVNVFPSQIEEVLFAIEGCEPHYQLVVDRRGAMDVLEVRIEVTENIFFDEMKLGESGAGDRPAEVLASDISPYPCLHAMRPPSGGLFVFCEVVVN